MCVKPVVDHDSIPMKNKEMKEIELCLNFLEREKKTSEWFSTSDSLFSFYIREFKVPAKFKFLHLSIQNMLRNQENLRMLTTWMS